MKSISTVIEAPDGHEVQNHEDPGENNRLVSWNFDVIPLEGKDKWPLTWLGRRILSMFDACKLLSISEETLVRWLSLIEEHYHQENPYHNATHAADVLQATAVYLRTPRLQKLLDPLEQVACLIAASCHDVDHPGYTNAFLMNSDHDLALLYNDRAILESHHSALAFKLTVRNPEVNIFRNLSRDVYRGVRASIVDMILATEMSQHKVHVTNFVNMLKLSEAPLINGSQRNDESFVDMNIFNNQENRNIVKRVLIKCADVSNPARPLNISVKWTKRISEEFFRQTEEEIVKGLPLSLPGYERATCSIPNSQIGFYNFFITDLYTVWHGFVALPDLMKHFKTNYDFWQDLEERKIRTVVEVENYLENHVFGPNEQN